jgi:hypothetical protein
MSFEHVDWDNLMQAITQGTCTPFIGAGACAGNLPLAGDLAEALADHDGYLMKMGRRDLARVTQFMAVKHKNGNYPKGELANFFGMRPPEREVVNKDGCLAKLYRSRRPPDFSDENDPHSVLADLKSAIYLTTNYDDFMFRALKVRRTSLGINEPKRDLCRWTNTLFQYATSPFDSGYEPRRDQPVVYHLHGHADVLESIVTTEDDYTDFIVNLSSELTVSKIGKGKKERLPLAIRKVIRNNTLLFVGYQVADQNLRVILRLLSQTLGSSEQRLNVAIQLTPDTGPEADPTTIAHIQGYLEARYRWSLNLQVYWGDAREFARELRQQMNRRQLPKEHYASESNDNRTLSGAPPV